MSATGNATVNTPITEGETGNNMKRVPIHDKIESAMLNMVNSHSEEMKKVHESEAASLNGKKYYDLLDQYYLIEKGRQERNRKILRGLKWFSISVAILLFVWIVVSYCNVVGSTASENPSMTLWTWNFFKVFI